MWCCCPAKSSCGDSVIQIDLMPFLLIPAALCARCPAAVPAIVAAAAAWSAFVSRGAAVRLLIPLSSPLLCWRDIDAWFALAAAYI
jgi:hypothetical protein